MTKEGQEENHNAFSKDDISIKEFNFKVRHWFQFIQTKWKMIIVFALLGGLSGFVYAYLKSPIYKATTTFVLEDEKGSGSGLGSLSNLASMAGIDFGGSGGGIFQGDNILGLYKSRSMLEQTLFTEVEVDGKRQLLIDRYIDFNKMREKWADKPAFSSIKFTVDSTKNGLKVLKPVRLRDSIVSEIVKKINLEGLVVTKPDKKLSSIQVDVMAKDEVFAKIFNDELVRNVNEFYLNTRTKKSAKNIEILQHKKDSVENVMNGSIFRAVAIADATPNLNPTRQIKRVAPAQQAQFSAETNKAILAELVKNLEMAKMGLLKEAPLIQIIDQPIYPLEKEQPSKIKSVLLIGFLLSFFYILYLTVFSYGIKQLKKENG